MIWLIFPPLPLPTSNPTNNHYCFLYMSPDFLDTCTIKYKIYSNYIPLFNQKAPYYTQYPVHCFFSYLAIYLGKSFHIYTYSTFSFLYRHVILYCMTDHNLADQFPTFVIFTFSPITNYIVKNNLHIDHLLGMQA